MSDIFTASDPSCSTFCSLTTWDEPPDEKARQKVVCDDWLCCCDEWCGCGVGRLMYMGKIEDGKLKDSNDYDYFISSSSNGYRCEASLFNIQNTAHDDSAYRCFCAESFDDLEISGAADQTGSTFTIDIDKAEDLSRCE